MKQQISNRLGVAHVRDTMMQFVAGAITRQQAMESLQVGQSQLYSLRTSYLKARAQGRGDGWEPGSSGGNHMPAWPDEVQSFLRRALRPDYFLGRSNPPLQLIDMVDYRNGFERHRELHDMPLNVWTEKIRSGQCKLRQPPQDGWWELTWSEWKGSAVGPRGRLLVDGVLCTTECANGTRVWICRHVDGTVSLVLNKPEKGTSPKVVFTNNTKVYRSR